MFVMKKVGRKISELRKQKNMTQLELADRMGVSFQAVSNWERGNSMPDISKLPELAEIFGTTIDNILGAKSELIKKAAEGKLEEYVESNPVSLEEIKEAAPILKPNQMVEIVDKNVKVICEGGSGVLTINGKSYDLDKLEGTIILNEEDSDDEASDSAEQDVSEAKPADDGLDVAEPEDSGEYEIDLKDIEELLPYLDEDAVGLLAKKLFAKGEDIEALLPHMDEDDITAIALDVYNKYGISMIVKCCDYIDEDALGKIAIQEVQKNGIGAILPIIDYLDEDDVGRIAAIEAEKNDMAGILAIAEYIDEDDLGEIALKEVQKNGIKAVIPIADYLDDEVVGKVAAIEAEKNGIAGIIPLADYMDEDDLGRIVLKESRKNGIKDIMPLIDYLDEDVVAEIAINVIKKDGIKAAKPLLPYVDEDVISEFIKKIL